MEYFPTPDVSANGKILKFDLSKNTWQETAFVLSLLSELGPKLGLYSYILYNTEHPISLLEKLVSEMGLGDYVCGSIDDWPGI